MFYFFVSLFLLFVFLPYFQLNSLYRCASFSFPLYLLPSSSFPIVYLAPFSLVPSFISCLIFLAYLLLLHPFPSFIILSSLSILILYCSFYLSFAHFLSGLIASHSISDLFLLLFHDYVLLLVILLPSYLHFSCFIFLSYLLPYVSVTYLLLPSFSSFHLYFFASSLHVTWFVSHFDLYFVTLYFPLFSPLHIHSPSCFHCFFYYSCRFLVSSLSLVLSSSISHVVITPVLRVCFIVSSSYIQTFALFFIVFSYFLYYFFLLFSLPGRVIRFFLP